jgi:hypothetical protein
MVTKSLGPGDRSGNPATVADLLDFAQAGVSVRAARTVGGVELIIKSAGDDPITVVMAPRQARAIARLLQLFATIVETLEEPGQ